MERTKKHDRARQSRYASKSDAGIANPRARQRALCVAALPPVRHAGEGIDELAELKELLRTAGVAVAGELVQRRPHPDPNAYLGAGKLTELKHAAQAVDANLIACDDELLPRQERNLEREVGLPVIDRTAVILDIFADHADSAEGKLQVELAQLEYNLARMAGLWTHLERLGGGIGTRGPGETQIETDRRLARDRIAALKRRLRRTGETRRLARRQREASDQPRVALAGYTNAGKSTLMNALTDAEASVGEQLFHTLDPKTRAFRYEGRTYLLTDTVGFIRKLPHQLVESFKATLEETINADLILHVVDAAVPEPEREAMIAAVQEVLGEIGAEPVPMILVLNKIDLLPAQDRELLARRPLCSSRDAVLLSAATGEGVDDLRCRIERAFRSRLEPVELLVPFEQGGILSELHEVAGDLEREDTMEGVLVRARVPATVAERMRPYECNGRRGA
ncbi:MAG: GTPase HflX [Solirubrobacterales bacterium]